MRLCKDCGTRFEPAHEWHSLCWHCFRERRRPVFDRPAPEQLLDERTLRGAIRLAHPDAQPPERREQATEITAKLIGALEVVRANERWVA